MQTWPEDFKRVHAEIDFGHGHRVGTVRYERSKCIITHEDGGETVIDVQRVRQIVDIAGQPRGEG